jgi:hypothetical protein
MSDALAAHGEACREMRVRFDIERSALRKDRDRMIVMERATHEHNLISGLGAHAEATHALVA